MCQDCQKHYSSSKYEDEIADYIGSFYSGELIRNNRDIISPYELDLYYPEKKIAIEFNDDYWHNEEHKPIDYHYNKYLNCKQQGILLVSILESDWSNKKDQIKEYLKDLFNGKENKLSFNEDKTFMNNNYPSIKLFKTLNSYIENSYEFNKKKIYTCGFSRIV